MEAKTFSEVVFDILHHGQRIHNYKTTTKAKKAMADHIEKLHLELLNEAEDAVRDELEASYAEFVPEPEPEQEEVYSEGESTFVNDEFSSSISVEVVKDNLSFWQKVLKIFGI